MQVSQEYLDLVNEVLFAINCHTSSSQQYASTEDRAASTKRYNDAIAKHVAYIEAQGWSDYEYEVNFAQAERALGY